MQRILKMLLVALLTQVLPVQASNMVVLSNATVNSSRPLARPTIKAGQLDSTFGDNGTGYKITNLGGTDDIIWDLALQPDGKIVVGGSRNVNGNNDFVVARYTTAGQLDSTFGDNGTGYKITNLGGTDYIYALALQPDGKIVVGGQSDVNGNNDFVVARYTTAGQLDSTFGHNNSGYRITSLGVGTDRITALALQPDGKIVVGGFSAGDFAVARYTIDGQLDSTFGDNGTGYKITSLGGADIIWALALQPDGKIVVGGTSDVNGEDDFVVARYTTAGQLDTTFGHNNSGYRITSLGLSDIIWALALQPDGKIVVGGRSELSTNDFAFAVARYTIDGQLDSTFGDNGTGYKITNLGGTDYIYALALQPDGKIVVGGQSDVNGNNDFVVARYTTAGQLDSTFGHNNSGYRITSLGFGTDRINALALQPDGKIVVGGFSAGDFVVARYTTDIDPLTQSALLFANGGGGLVS